MVSIVQFLITFTVLSPRLSRAFPWFEKAAAYALRSRMRTVKGVNAPFLVEEWRGTPPKLSYCREKRSCGGCCYSLAFVWTAEPRDKPQV